jgi:hypothetical protein
MLAFIQRHFVLAADSLWLALSQRQKLEALPSATAAATAWHAPLIENHFNPTNSGRGKFQLFHLAE